MKRSFPPVFPFLFLSILALIMGLWAGLVRIGWSLPASPATLPMQHGPLMISGFLGTMIALERVVAIRAAWMYAAPLCSGLGWVLSLALPGSITGPLLISLGSLVTVGILSVMVRQEPKIYTTVMATGSVCWFVGNVLWIMQIPIFIVVWWWAGFLVLTIAGERLELSRVQRFEEKHYWLFSLVAGIFLSGITLTAWLPSIGIRVTGLGMLALSVWLICYDIARRNILRAAGLPRFIATCLFTGFLWLGLSGIFNLRYGFQTGGFLYDAILHSVFVGFVMAMIFGHAPIIFPALTGVNVVYQKTYYFPLALLHVSLILRICADLSAWQPGRMWGGILNEVAVLAFMGLFIFNMIQQKRTRAVSEQP